MVRSDHHALQWIFKLKDPTGQMARWQETLANFDFEIIYRPGKLHRNADGMSRIPWELDVHTPVKLPCNTCRKCARQENPSHTVNAVQTRHGKQKQRENSEIQENSPQNPPSWVCRYTAEELRQEQERD